MIRSATLQDFDRIMEMLINFANASPYAPLKNPEYNDTYVRNVLCEIMKSGYILVGEQDGKLQGMFISYIHSDIWLPHKKTLREMIWWVEPVARGSTLGFRLLKEYTKIGKKLTEEGVVDGFVLTTMEISPIDSIEKRGWRKVESNYVYQGA